MVGTNLKQGGTNGNKEKGSKEESSKEEGSKEESSKEESSKEESSKEENSKEEISFTICFFFLQDLMVLQLCYEHLGS